MLFTVDLATFSPAHLEGKTIQESSALDKAKREQQ
jgi:hypothetical protein